MSRHRYGRDLDPPAPVVPVRVQGPGSELGVVLPALLDTGADCTLVPADLPREVGLPEVDVIAFKGVGGAVVRAPVHAARLEIGGASVLARVAAFGDEFIIGRDVLNRAVALFDGPKLEVSLRWPKPSGRVRARS